MLRYQPTSVPNQQVLLQNKCSDRACFPPPTHPPTYSPYSSAYSSPYSSSLSTSYSTLTSSMETKLPGLEPFLTSSFPSTYSNGSGLMLGSQSTEFGVKSLLKSTTEKPSFMSRDPLPSHMTTATSYLCSPKSQPRAGLQPPPISKVRTCTDWFDYLRRYM